MEEFKEKLTQANSIFRRFFHDARTSLTVIGGYVSVMMDGDAGEISPGQREYLNIINKSVNKVQLVMEEVSDFLLLWTGHIVPKKATVDLKNIILESIKNIDDSARKKGIIISYEINLKEVPVFADGAVMSKALVYFLNDYLKLLPASSKVRISLLSRGDDFQITFRDNVLEVAPDVIPLVFQGFYQNERASSEDDRELGLGFPIAKTIIEMHEGKLWMEPDSSGKTFISFTVPRRKEEDRAKVLIVEDNEFIARLWVDKLRKAEYTVLLAASSGACLDMARSEKPSLIILDVMIPGGMDGFEVCQKLKETEDFRGVPILIVSNLWQENLVEKARSAGATEFISKSRISPAELLEKVKNVLEKEQQKKELQKKV